MSVLKPTINFTVFTFLAVWAGSMAARAQESAEDKPVATLSLKEVFEDYFKVGVAVNRSITMGQAFRRTEEEVKSDTALVIQHFNHLVAENDMKWQLIHPRPGSEGYDFAPADALMEFAADHGMEVAGHTLVWHSQTPNWVFEGTNVVSEASPAPGGATAANETQDHVLTISPPRSFPSNLPPNAPANTADISASNAQNANNQRAPENQQGGRRPNGFGGPNGPRGFRGFDLNGPRATREELLERMREHIHTVVTRYKGKVKVWDVVNEALSDGGDEVLRRSPWSVIIGPDFIAKAFEYAHEADPDAILRYNDYGLENDAKRAKLITLIKHLQEQNVPITAIGSQAHLNVEMTYEKMDLALTEMAQLGLPIHITELDINAAAAGQRNTNAEVAANAATTQGGLVQDYDQKLSEAYAGVFQAFVKHKDSVDVVTFWGVNDAVSWRARGKPLLFDEANQPKRAFDAVLATIKQADQ